MKKLIIYSATHDISEKSNFRIKTRGFAYGSEKYIEAMQGA